MDAKKHKKLGDTALFVIDVQDEFCNPARTRGTQRTHAAAERIADIIEDFRAEGVRIYSFYYRLPHEKGIDPYLYEPAGKDMVFRKTCDSVFQGTSVERLIRDANVKTVITCGFNLSACLYESVLDARKRGFDTIVAGDLVGDGTNVAKPAIEAVREMKDQGARFLHSKKILEQLKSR